MVNRRTLRRSDGHRTVTVIDEDATPAHDEYAAHAGEEDVVRTYPDSAGVARGFVRMFNMLVAFTALVIETLLAFRLAFALGGANAANGFVEFIYDVSGPFVAPFEGIRNEELAADGVFEPETVIAMVVYAVAALLIIIFMSIVSSAPRTGPETSVVTRERHAHMEEEEV